MYRAHVVSGLQLNQMIPNFRTITLQAYMMVMLVLKGDVYNAREELSVDQQTHIQTVDHQSTHIGI